MTSSLFLRTAAIALFALCGAAASAQTAVERQDQAAVLQKVTQFLQMQATGLPGDVNISVGKMDARLNLPACAAMEAFLPKGSRVWGKTTVGVRCSAPQAWTVYVAASIKVTADYIVTAAPLAQGQLIGPNDIATVKGDLTALPPGIITDAAQAVGHTMAASLTPGTPLRADSLRNQQAVQQGQTVRLVSNGPGFRISAEARALNNAADGQMLQARTATGQVVTGIAKPGGVVEVTY